MTYGILLTRAQPIHKGHIAVLKHILTECDKALLVIGSANKKHTKRNPFDIKTRVAMVTDALKDEGLSKNVTIMTLSDWSQEDAYQYANEWGRFLYYNIVNVIQQKTFIIYYNDNPEIIQKWFSEDIQSRVTIKTTPRISDISSTQVRAAIEKMNTVYLSETLCLATYEKWWHLRDILLRSNQTDFMMS